VLAFIFVPRRSLFIAKKTATVIVGELTRVFVPPRGVISMFQAIPMASRLRRMTAAAVRAAAVTAAKLSGEP
jgi:hypothetical protein